MKVISDPSYRFGHYRVDGGDRRGCLGSQRGTHSVTEVDASTGALVRVISGPKYQFRSPWQIAAGGDRLWVTNLEGNTVTTFPAA